MLRASNVFTTLSPFLLMTAITVYLFFPENRPGPHREQKRAILLIYKTCITENWGVTPAIIEKIAYNKG
jgi:hypothetical protein